MMATLVTGGTGFFNYSNLYVLAAGGIEPPTKAL